MKPQRATLLLLVFCLAVTPALAEQTRKNRSRDGGPGLHRLQQMGYNGPVKPASTVEPTVATRGGNVILYVAPPPLGSNANDGLMASTPFQTIQFAFAQAASGDEIRVLPGTYNECINNTAFALGIQKNLAVIADDWVVNGNRNSTVIDGNGACAEPFSVVNLAGTGTPGSRLEGFTVVNAADSGVFLIGSGVVTENLITNNTGLDGGGMFIYPGTCYYGAATVQLSNNTITNNTADDRGNCTPGGEPCTTDSQCSTGATCAILGGNGGGLYIRGKAVNAGGTIGCIGGDSRVTVTNNVIDGNGADFAFGGGLYVKTDAESGRLSTVAVTQNLISNNTTLPFSLGYGGGAWLGTFGYGTEQIDFDNNSLTGNSTTGDGGGISAWVDTQTQGDHTLNLTNNDVVPDALRASLRGTRPAFSPACRGRQPLPGPAIRDHGPGRRPGARHRIFAASAPVALHVARSRGRRGRPLRVRRPERRAAAGSGRDVAGVAGAKRLAQDHIAVSVPPFQFTPPRTVQAPGGAGQTRISRIRTLSTLNGL